MAKTLFQHPARVVEAGDDPRLRSVTTVNHHHVHATDGDIGHVANFLADDINWDIRYLVVATSTRACTRPASAR
jgi:hypothetical protein